MLRRQPSRPVRVSAEARFAIVASNYNAMYVDGMLAGALREFKKTGTKAARVRIVRVPGAFEIPVVASKLASTRAVHALICLGVILQGETRHAEHIALGVTHALAQIQREQHLPVIHEVLLFANESQARVRCLGRTHNRGAEAARTAIAMVKVMDELGDS